MLLLAATGFLRGAAWYLNLLLAAGGVLVLVATGRPLFRTAVYRISGQEVLCRFVPWYQPNTLVASLIFPIVGIAAIAMGRESDSPAWVRYAGYLGLVAGIVFVLFALIQSRNRLSFTPDTLAVRLGRQFRLPRERVVAVKPRALASTGTGQTTRHYDLVYDPGDGRTNRIMAMLDMQFSVDPDNLATALNAWKDGDPNDPGLIDRIETILHGRPNDP